MEYSHIKITRNDWIEYKPFFIDLFTRITSFFSTINSHMNFESSKILNSILDSEVEEKEVYILCYTLFRLCCFIKVISH